MLTVEPHDSVESLFLQVAEEMDRLEVAQIGIEVELPSGERVVYMIQAVDVFVRKGLH